MSKLTDLLLADAYIGGGSGGGGETWTETLLWENPNPTSSLGSATILSQEQYSAFQFLRIVWRYSTSDDSTRDIIAPTANIDPTILPATTVVLAAMTNSSNKRFVSRDADRYGFPLIFTQATGMYNSNNSTSQVIPLAIYGIKKG